MAGLFAVENTFSVIDDANADVAKYGYLGGEVTASVKVTNTSAADRDVMIAIAVYNETGMKTVHIGKTLIPATGAPVSATLSFDPGEYYDSDTDCIRVFVWDGSRLTPLKASFDANSDGEII